MTYNKEMKKFGDFMFGIKLSHMEKNNCVEFQTVGLSVCMCLTNYVSVYQNVDMGVTYDG